MTECLIALGGNIGDVSDTFAAALERLATHPDIDISAVSRCFVTEPVGEDAGEAYLNAAAALSTSMEPARLLETTKEVEISLGRPADHATWAPRSVDLDLVTFGDLVLEDDRLRVPHPGCWYRRFVLDPVCRIAGSTRHPAWQLTFAQLRERLMVRPLPVWLDMDARNYPSGCNPPTDPGGALPPRPGARLTRTALVVQQAHRRGIDLTEAAVARPPLDAAGLTPLHDTLNGGAGAGAAPQPGFTRADSQGAPQNGA